MPYTVFGAPFRYVQGRGASCKIGEYILPYGKNVVVAGGRSGLGATRDQRGKSFSECGIHETEYAFGGESSEKEISKLAAFAKNAGCEVLVASGGGKAIDAVKAAAEDIDVPAVIMPTIASNDAPCSALSVIYNDDGSFNRLRPLKKSPYVVLVDTEIIVNAPVRQLVSGMGDALATWYEAQICLGSGTLNNFGGSISSAAMALSSMCRSNIYSYGIRAKQDCELKKVTEAVERVVEANTLLSGLGFESAGVALAHAVSESLAGLPSTHKYTHGEKVAFGLMAHMVLAKVDIEERERAAEFCINVGLPVTLEEVGVDASDTASVMLAANAAAEEGRPSHNFGFPVSAEMIFDAVMEADSFGRKMKNAHRG